MFTLRTTHTGCEGRVAGPALLRNVAFLRRLEKGSTQQESPIEEGLGGEPCTVIGNSWGGWGGTTC